MATISTTSISANVQILTDRANTLRMFIIVQSSIVKSVSLSKVILYHAEKKNYFTSIEIPLLVSLPTNLCDEQ